MLPYADLKSLVEQLHPDALIFDIDGVLLEVKSSYIKAIELTVARVLKRCGRPAPPALSVLVERLKRVKGYNNDWDCSYALVLIGLAAGGPEEYAGIFTALESAQQSLPAIEATLCPLLEKPEEYDRALIWRDFQGYYLGKEKLKELYGGESDFEADPLYLTENPWVKTATFESLATAYKLGVYTGRNREEAELAFTRLGFYPAAVVADDGVCKKPDPAGLARLQRELGFKRALYFGDSVDDATAVTHFGSAADLRLIAIGGDLPGAVLRLEPEQLDTALRTIIDK